MGTPFYDVKPPASYLALSIAVEEYLSSSFFKKDFSRVIYSSNSYALRKRSSKSKTQGLNFPFANYRINNITKETEYNLANTDLAINGAAFQKYGGYLYPLAVSFEFEMTFYFENTSDTMVCMNRLLMQDSLPLILFPVVEVKVSENESFNLEFPAHLNLSPQLNPEYRETDWFEKNKINTIGCDFVAQSFIFDTKFGVCVPETVVFNFAKNHGIPTEGYDETLIGIIDHLSETVDFS